LTSLRLFLRLTALLAILGFFSSLLTSQALAARWFPFGPDGGDARSFAPDPHDHDHLYLGTTNGWIYDSHNGGKSWERLARVGHRDDLVLDSIIVDPVDSRHIIAGTWVLGQSDGGLFISHDGGLSWVNNPEMAGQAVLALTAAPSDAHVLVAGTLQGVFRSNDGGVRWSRISPEGSKEVHEVESIAIDPTNPDVIYAGTWHLPWKTTDGGVTWNNIKQGIIDDSDVFSIIVDPKQPSVVYASACSGIYKSTDAGDHFAKVQGIPTSARRTRVLMQDPEHLETVFAGTTEGLFRTDDAGAYWKAATSNDLIINDVYVDPVDSQRVLLATDRGGILASRDGGVSFFSSNSGFSARQVTAFAEDPRRPADLFLGVVNDKQWGGAFLSHNGGLSWTQYEEGLEGNDVFALAEASDGKFFAGTSHGIFWFDPETLLWKHAGDIGTVHPAPARRGHPASPATARPTRIIDGNVLSMTRFAERLFAVTADGIFSSDNPTVLWSRVDGLSAEPWRFIASSTNLLIVASLHSISVSIDGGHTWQLEQPPAALTQVGAVATDDQGELWVGGREGVFVSSDRGLTWAPLKNLYVSDVNSIFFDQRNARLLITANSSTTMAYAVELPSKAVKYWDTGWNLRFLRPVGDYLLGATLFDGIVLQPRMVQSKPVAP